MKEARIRRLLPVAHVGIEMGQVVAESRGRAEGRKGGGRLAGLVGDELRGVSPSRAGVHVMPSSGNNTSKFGRRCS